MNLIIDRYAEIKDMTEFEDSKDKLIFDCFKYNIFTEYPSKRFIEDFRDDIDYAYPMYVSDISKKMASKLRAKIKFCKVNDSYVRTQRAKRCYAYVDVYNMDSWFIRTVSEMLKQHRIERQGFPADFLSSDEPTPEEFESANEKWESILDRMIFLIDEMDADKCSMKNPYKGKYEKLFRKFHTELGWFGEKAKSPEELAEEKERGVSKAYYPWHFPDKYPTALDIKNNYFKYEEQIEEYMDKCKDEFFSLFSKYFWMLRN